jgi:threonine dehydrogenase-like Zn-dependent dehydrogenase
MGQMHGQKYMPMLLGLIMNDEIDPSVVFSHDLPLEEAKQGYEIFKHKKRQLHQSATEALKKGQLTINKQKTITEKH